MAYVMSDVNLDDITWSVSHLQTAPGPWRLLHPVADDGSNLKDGKTYHPWRAYGSSKVAVMLFNVHLSALLKGKGVQAFAVQPGSIYLIFSCLPNFHNTPCFLVSLLFPLGSEIVHFDCFNHIYNIQVSLLSDNAY